ncbi:hypothetical protein SSOG_05609 [Streptomyces himastatinicus ATCC 53653]|uniref:Uncharacterized protein n=1 Tax=Streptomyces himastatinicus ATCC 53653 TaxID=457427 RepID=D9WNN8_9ACTN|nr:hypothetical protein [Streptomyces himastatinicus]EFL25895.1 hypothetical protein SSOG_05609 [Streptomyces himastatinicus ATCC 53653]
MNIGKTAALVTAAAGAVVFGGADAGALDLDSPLRQTNECDTLGPVQGSSCLNFAQIFGDPHGVVQANRCDSAGPSNTGNLIFTTPLAAASNCANIAVSAQPSTAEVTHRNAYGHAVHGDGHR